MKKPSKTIVTTYCFVFQMLLCTVVHGQTLKQLEKILDEAGSLKAFLKNTDLQDKYHKAFKKYLGKDDVGCEPFQKVLAHVRKLSESFLQFDKIIWEQMPVEDVFVVDAKGLSEEGKSEESFSRFAFRPLRRRFHSILILTGYDRCEKKSCESSESSVSERWDGLMDNNRIVIVEREGRYLGLSLIIYPITKLQSTFSLVDPYEGPYLSKEIKVQDQKSGKLRTTSLFDLWLNYATTRKPKEIEQYVIKRSMIENNTKTFEIVPAPLRWMTGSSLGKEAEFKTSLDFRKQVASVLPEKCVLLGKSSDETPYQTTMETPNNSPQAKVSLNDETIKTNESNPNGFIQILNNVKYPSQLGGPLERFVTENPNQVKVFLSDALRKSEDPTIRNKAIIAMTVLNAAKPRILSRSNPLPNIPNNPPISNTVNFFSSPQSNQNSNTPRASFNFEDDLKFALKDPSDEVKINAALALAETGIKTPAVNKALNQSMEKPISGNINPILMDQQRRATESLGNTFDDIFKKYIDNAMGTKDPNLKDAQWDAIADMYAKHGTLDQMSYIKEKMTTPEDAKKIIGKINERVEKTCAECGE